MDLNFYKCIHCANLFITAIASGAVPACCGDTTQLLVAGSTDAAVEKHVPVIEREDDGNHITVKVGAVPHPMTEEHHIDFIVLAYGERFDFVKVDGETEAATRFCIRDNTIPLTAYAYCNLHGLWKVDV